MLIAVSIETRIAFKQSEIQDSCRIVQVAGPHTGAAPDADAAAGSVVGS